MENFVLCTMRDKSSLRASNLSLTFFHTFWVPLQLLIFYHYVCGVFQLQSQRCFTTLFPSSYHEFGKSKTRRKLSTSRTLKSHSDQCHPSPLCSCFCPTRKVPAKALAEAKNTNKPQEHNSVRRSRSCRVQSTGIDTRRHWS